MIASRKAEACEAAARELSSFGPCEGFGGTVATEAGVAALAAETRKRTDGLHILINNAGLTWGEPFETYPWKAWERIMSVIRWPVLADPRSRADADRVGRRRKAIDDRQRRFGDGLFHAVGKRLRLFRLEGRRASPDAILAQELAGRQVTVNAIAPGPFPTNMTRFALGDEAGAARALKRFRWAGLGDRTTSPARSCF